MIGGGGAAPPAWFLGAVACALPVMWLWVSFVLSYAGGWWMLARRHRAATKPTDGVTYGLCGGRLGEFGARYGGSLKVTVAREGLYVVPLLIFRLFHPPLLLPWSCVTGTREGRVLFTRQLEVNCETEGRKTKLFLPAEAAEVVTARGVGT